MLPHNTHLETPEEFLDRDPHLRSLKKLPLVHYSDLLCKLPVGKPGIFTLSGGRQIGKTTLMKQWIAELLKNRFAPRNIAYLTGEIIDDHHTLVRVLSETLDNMSETDFRCIILDEVTYIRDWDKGVKYLADAGLLENTGLFLTGSDLSLIKEARMRFPGRRGKEDIVDFHLHPLNFLETVRLRNRLPSKEVDHLLHSTEGVSNDSVEKLFEEFDSYLLHGGFLTACNDLESHKRILPATYATYSDWIRGDFLARGRQEHSLREVLGVILKHHGSQITWNSLLQDLSIEHPKTISDYVNLLESMDVVFIQHALQEDKLAAAPKKARKLMFTDPFIFHSVRAWVTNSRDPYKEQAAPILSEPEEMGALVESCAATLYSRRFPTFYIKARGEVDIAYIRNKRFWPVEIKWTNQIRPKTLKQIEKYPNGLILGKSRQLGKIRGIPVLPLPLELLRLGSISK